MEKMLEIPFGTPKTNMLTSSDVAFIVISLISIIAIAAIAVAIFMVVKNRKLASCYV